MLSNVLQPTKENLLKTFKADTLCRNTVLVQFIRLLTAVEGNVSISLDGRWGCGKTFFVRQCQLVLDAYNPWTNRLNENEIESIKSVDLPDEIQEQAESAAFVTAYYDAWMHDSDPDPLLSLVYEILRSAETDYSFAKTKNVFESAAAVATTIFKLIDIGTMLRGVPQSFQNKQIDAGTIFENPPQKKDPFEELRARENLQREIQEFFTSLLPEKGNRLILFIDELDRCRPSYAVQILERIKHYFTDDRITFVFSINSLELSKTIKNYYGMNFDGCRYLDRFFDFRVPLPPVDTQRLASLLHVDSYSLRGVTCKWIVESFHMELREALRFQKVVNIIEKEPDDIYYGVAERAARSFCSHVIIPIMLALRMCDIEQYVEFVHGQNSEALQIVFKGKAKAESWLAVLLDADECYPEGKVEGRKEVTIQKKLEKVYSALFIEKDILQTKNKERYIGNLCFDRYTYDWLMKEEGLLSEYANYAI